MNKLGFHLIPIPHLELLSMLQGNYDKCLSQIKRKEKRDDFGLQQN